jgi:CheY-like chemotaxis protein
MDGLETADVIRNELKLKDARIVLLSSWGGIDADRVRELGLSTVLTKPVKRSSLFDALKRLQEGEEKETERAPEESLRKARVARRAKILLVEDIEESRRVVKRLLQKEGHAVEVAENGTVAVEATRNYQYDLIFMDIQMPEMDGFDATRTIRAWEEGNQYDRVPIVALTAHATAGYREGCFECGMDDYIPKPVSKMSLKRILTKWLNTRPVVLVVDDSIENRRIVERNLKHGDAYELVFAQNGLEALDIFRRRSISLVLMDIGMPVMDGFRATTAIRTLPDGDIVPILAMTAYQEKEEIDNCFKAGCTGYIVKPIRGDDLRRRVSAGLLQQANNVTGKTGDSPQCMGKKDSGEEYAESEVADVVKSIDPDVEDLVSDFLEKRKKDVESIDKFLVGQDKGSFEAIEKLGHSMKGSGGSYGLNRVSEIGKALYDAAKENDRRTIESLNASLSEYLGRIEKEFRQRHDT